MTLAGQWQKQNDDRDMECVVATPTKTKTIPVGLNSIVTAFNRTRQNAQPITNVSGWGRQQALMECVLATPTKSCFWRHNQNGNRAHNSVIVQSEQQNQRPTTEKVSGWGRQQAFQRDRCKTTVIPKYQTIKPFFLKESFPRDSTQLQKKSFF